MMSLAEYEELLADLVARDKITIEQAQELRQRFINGEFNDEDLPLPLVQAQEKDDNGLALYMLSIFPRTGITRQPDKVRKDARDDAMRHFDLMMAGIGHRLIAKTGKFHQESKRVIEIVMLANWLAGNGTNTTPDIGDLVTEQLNYLYRFAGEQHVMNALGTPMSESQTVNRLLLYGGAVWAAWFIGNESYNYGDGYVAQYVAVDDGRTCQPCRSAVGYYRINEGPIPGQICYGGGRCRCERITIYAPEILARL